jgi:putative SOS response-associated peptidase YedK
MKWGLVPHWSKLEDKTLSTINARAENLMESGESGIWGSVKGKKRCIVVAQGWVNFLSARMNANK